MSGCGDLYLIGLSEEHDDEGFSAGVGHPMTSRHSLIWSHDYSARVVRDVDHEVSLLPLVTTGC